MTSLSITRIKIQSLLVVLVLACAIDIVGADVDPTFNPILTSTLTGNFNGVEVLQPDGKWILLGGSPRFIQRVNPDGTVDPTFDCPACLSFSPLIAAVQADGKILVGGPQRLIRVHPNGTLDTTFSTKFNPIIASASGIKFLFPLADGKTLLLCGSNSSGDEQDRVLKLNNDGTPDPTFTQISLQVSPRQYANAMIVQPDGKMMMGGGFQYPGSGGWLARYNADGTVDGTFTATANSYVEGIAIFPDGRYIVTGWFSSINGVSRSRYARLFADGSLDSSLTITPGGYDLPYDVEMLPNGQFYIYTIENHSPNPSPTRFVRYNNDGSVDNSFSSTFFNPSSYWDVDDQGRIVTLKTISGQSRYYRLNLDGSVEGTFNPIVTVRGTVKAAALQSDGKIVITGAFEKANGVATTQFIRLNADGTTDGTFNPGTGFNVQPDKITIAPDGKILACGLFAGYNGTWRSNLARINTDGSVDHGFNATIDNRVRAVGALPNGKVVIGGDFLTINGTTQKGLALLNSDGSLDTTFTPVFGSFITVYTILVEPGGSFLVGGYFAGVNGVSTSGLMRFLSNGNVDTGFSANAQRTNAIARRPDGKYIVATKNVGGNDPSEVFRLNSNGSRDYAGFQARPAGSFVNAPDVTLQPNGNVIYSAPASLNFIDRVGPNGELDIFFPTFGANNSVGTLITQPDGKIIVAGSFSGIEDVGRAGIARLTLSNRTRATLFDYDGDGRSDISVFRPSTNTWYEILSGTWTVRVQTFGASGDMIAPADYDADGKTDIGVFKPSTADWLHLYSSTNTLVQRHWGLAGDIPLASDIDGDGTAEMIVYRPSTGQWFWLGSQMAGIQFGVPGDQPVIGDFDGDSRTDPAIFRPSTGEWWYAASSAGNQPRASHWGQNGDVPVPADYDGDAITDHAIFRPSEGGWYIYNSTNGSYTAVQFGTAGDRPAAGDYDGDGRADIAIYRPSTGIWYLWMSTSGFAGVQFGISEDVPTPGAFLQ